MTIFSRRKRLLNRTPRAPKMSSRRQFHRALRRHPAWPAVMEQAAARARAQENIRRDRSGITAMGQASTRARLQRIFFRNRTGLRRFTLPVALSVKGLWPDTATAAWRSSKLRRNLRRNRVLVVTLLAVGGLVAVLTGLAVGQGNWIPAVVFNEDSNRPRARFGAAATYDESIQSTVVFGGFVGSTSASTGGVDVNAVSGPPILNDDQTYLFKGNAWGRRDPVRRPSPRGFASMAYDRARRNVVLFGGAPYNTNNVSGETWIWDVDGEGWTLQSPPEPRPDPRQNAVMVYDAHRKVIVMVGGRGADGLSMNDTWTWNGSAWKIVPRSAGDPSPRHSAAMTYDECRAEAVMFGGVGPATNNTVPQPFETWTWNGAKWTPQAPKLSPPPRIGASMEYSRRTGNVLLYGGLYTNEAGVATAATDYDVWRWVPGGYPGTGDQFAPTWERMNSEVTSAADNSYTAQLILGDLSPKAQPPPRAYATFSYLREDFWGSMFQLYGGTPSAGAGGAQVSYGDQFYFGDSGLLTGTDGFDGLLGLPSTPLGRRCPNPVPIPSDDMTGQIAAPEGPKYQAREGMREIGQFPVLIGADWPQANRNTHLQVSGNPPNPNYKPAPDCPNRPISNATSGNAETGANTYLFTNQKRNRVYQFFVCDTKRGSGYYKSSPSQPNPSYQNYPDVGKLLIEAYDGTTLDPLGRVVIGISSAVDPNLDTNLAQDIEQGRFFLTNYLSGTYELLVLEQDRIEKGADPIVKRINLTGAPNFALNNFFIHPKTGHAKLFFGVAPGGANTGSPPTVTTGPPPTVTPGSPPASSTPPKLGQWDIEDRREDWRVEIPGCTGLSSAMRSANHAHFVCPSSLDSTKYAVGKVFITENADGTETPRVPDEFPREGPTSFGLKVWRDPQAERMALLSITNGSSGAPVYTVWVFDGKTSRWVGRIGIGYPSDARWGFDDRAGRLYVHMRDSITGTDAKTQAQGGVKVIDIRLTPVSQPLTIPQFAFPPAEPSIASLPPAPGVPRRVFIRQAGGDMKKFPNRETVKFENEMFYTILADEIPVPGLADLADLDALTIPVAETPGKTEASFDAEGSGYGIRLRSVGGILSALRPPQQIYNSSNFIDNDASAFGMIRHLVPGCVFPDRELMAGWVPQARLSDLDALARSSGLEVDSNSKTDLQGPFSRCNPTAEASNFPASIKPVFDVLWPLYQLVQADGNKAASSGTVAFTSPTSAPTDTPTNTATTTVGTLTLGQEKKEQNVTPTVGFTATTSSSWDRHFKEVECVGDALATNTAAVGNIYGSAKCVQRQGMVEATARGSASGAADPATSAAGFSVGEGYSTVTVARELVRGVVVTSTAIAKGIQLPGITIGYVKTEAVAWSNGRPGVNRATFTRKICNVDRDPPIPINPPEVTKDDRAPSTGCLTEDQQKAMVKNWNSGWGINSKMYLPKPDPDYYTGSPGGYIAGVIKPVADETEDTLFAKDSQREVSGLVIDFYKDSPHQGNARQSLQLAAVRAVAGLGVQCNPDHTFSPPNNCVALSFDDDLLVEEFEEDFSEDEAELDSADSFWEEVEASLPEPLALGRRIGQFIQNLPVFRRLPIRQMGEALLAASVWMLLGMPLFLASRRFALNLARRS